MGASTVGWMLALVTLIHLSGALQQAPNQISSTRAHGRSRHNGGTTDTHQASDVADLEQPVNFNALQQPPESAGGDVTVATVKPLLQAFPHPCGTCEQMDCGPCIADAANSAKLVSDNIALNARVKDVEAELHNARVGEYKEDLQRAIASQQAKAETEHLQEQMSAARETLTKEHADLVAAIARTHEAELEKLEAEMRHNETLAEVEAYHRGFEEHGSLDNASLARLTDAAVADAVDAARKASRADGAQQSLTAFHAGEALGRILAGSEALAGLRSTSSFDADAAESALDA